jgi:molybdenum cofactor biosynthesis enzyme MoaA
MRQLATHFSNIHRNRLMGGEPLLHPRLQTFARAARPILTNARIIFVTKGTSLNAMKVDFLKECQRADVHLDLSL